MKIIALALLILLSLNMAFAKEIFEATIPDSLKCGDKTLTLQSAGLRTATIFNIRVYVVAIYGSSKGTTERPLCFEITYLRDVDNQDADKAWAFQFKESSEHLYPELQDHIKKLQDSFGDIQGERKHLFALLPGETQLSENGIFKGKIPGDDFQKNFLTIWFGKKPPTKEVQTQLLKGI